MLVIGIVVSVSSALFLGPLAPRQDVAVLVPSSSPQSGQLEGEIEPAVPEPQVLYPELPKIGDKIGTITLPSLELSWPIFEGTEEAQLSQGVGHFVGSVLPGVRDNSVLSGHRSSVFGRLGELVEGDLIHIQTSAGYFTYQVREFQVVPLTSREVIVPRPTAVLTITTCYPFNAWGPTDQAFIVTADLISSELVSTQ